MLHLKGVTTMQILYVTAIILLIATVLLDIATERIRRKIEETK
jgi:hypothetical protein